MNHFYSIPAACLALIALEASASATDQTASQEEAKRLQDQGSDDSLKSSYGNGLRAVNQFFKLNVPGAISYGVKAYGQYRNSEKLDNMKKLSNGNANAMASAGVSGPSGSSAITGKSESISPYARIDKKFLYEGETAAIAERIEKLSGISRDKMFDLAAKAHANSKSTDDPAFLSSVKATYRELTEESPNEEFRDKLKAFGDKTERLFSTGGGKIVLAQFQKQDQDPESSARSPASVVSEAAKTQTAELPAVVVTEVEVAAVVVRESSDQSGLDNTADFTRRGMVSAVTSHQRPGFERIQFDDKDPFFMGLVHASNNPVNNTPSIFQMVSKKIKEVSSR